MPQGGLASAAAPFGAGYCMRGIFISGNIKMKDPEGACMSVWKEEQVVRFFLHFVPCQCKMQD